MMRSFLLSLVAAFLASAPHAGDAADGIFDIPPGFTAEATTQKLREALADASIARIRFQDGQQYKLLPFKIDRPVLLEGRAEIVPADLTQPLIEVTAPDVAIKQLTFLGRDKQSDKSSFRRFLRVRKHSHRFRLSECTFRNFACRYQTTQFYCVEVELNDVLDWVITDCRFEDMQNEVDGVAYKKALADYKAWKDAGRPQPEKMLPRKPGFVGAIRVSHSGQYFGEKSSSGRITQCVFKNIYSSRRSGQSVDQFPGDWYDGDAIRIYVDRKVPAAHSNQSVDKEVAVAIHSCKFIDIQKSAVKAGEIGRTTISNCRVFNKRSDYPMMAGFRANITRGLRITSCEVHGRAERGVYIGSGGSAFIRGLVFLPYETLPDGSEEKCGIAGVELGRGSYRADRIAISGLYVSHADSAVNCVNCSNVSIDSVTLIEGGPVVALGSRADKKSIRLPKQAQSLLP
ncbi:right-handed parallel beta-helix repeat-containing protein [Thalassoglobus polymorphus]|nr:right-handed parallel beta-helix repeat-containing protein [Thalassoglobus polymorphus]